ncbi:MAG TPA: DUF211 domain-containing protein [Candidatus Bilamarchaeaceae archaeon]|nr:DUF211 domain-containing protein [Candidatus Bilamarchaeaceae archaeon]
MAGIRRMVLDVLIPLQISTVELAQKLSKMKGIEAVDILIQETERRVESAKVTIEGDELDYEQIKSFLEGSSISIQGVDRVGAGKRNPG